MPTDEPVRGRTSPQHRRLQSAINKAAGYRDDPESSAEQEDFQGPVRPMDEWRDIVSQRIDEAMRRGMFDNLPGRGKPLNLHRDPFLPRDQQMAVTLLRNNGLAPEWISSRKDILAAIDVLRADLRQAADSMRRERQTAPDDARRDRLRSIWTEWLNGWHERMDQVNRRILVQNLKQPVRHLEILMLRLPDELARARAQPEWDRDWDWGGE